MTDDVKAAMMEVVKEALLAEVKGHQLYTHAASTTTDPVVQGIFKSLAKDEEAHIAILKAQAKPLHSTGGKILNYDIAFCYQPFCDLDTLRVL